jgi:hypothetical protein
MRLGWVTLLDLLVARAEEFNTCVWKIIFAIETTALILSSSRTAWVFMLLEGVRCAPIVGGVLFLQIQRLTVGKWRLTDGNCLRFPS